MSHNNFSQGVYSLPFPLDRPEIRRMIAPTHRETGDIHAIDWFMPIGTPILAARDGKVKFRESRYNNFGGKELLEEGNGIVLEHEGREFSVYGHLGYHGVAVRKNEQISRGQFIGFSGQTGFANYPHLHFSVGRIDGNNIYKCLKINFVEGTDPFYLKTIFRRYPNAN